MFKLFFQKYWWIFLLASIFLWWASKNGLSGSNVEFLSLYKVLGDTFTFLVALLTIAIAFEGLTIWNKEIVGKFEFELTKDIVFWVSELRNQIFFMSSSWGSSAEITMNDQLEKIFDEEPDAIKSPFEIYQNPIFREMLTEFQALFTKSKDFQLKSSFVWGGDMVELSDIFNRIDSFCLKFQSNFFRANFDFGEKESLFIDVQKYDEDESIKNFLNIYNHSFIIEKNGEYELINYFKSYIKSFEKDYERLSSIRTDLI